MRCRVLLFLFCVVIHVLLAPAAESGGQHHVSSKPLPVVGGPCEGCELAFVDLPDHLQSRTTLTQAGDAGERLQIRGRVLNAEGKGVAGIVVYAYHTDARGKYPEGKTRHGRLRGWVMSDAEGRYQFDTIRPASYPDAREPQHVHMHIIEPNRATYYLDDLLFADDPKLTEQHRKSMNNGRGGSGLTTPSKDAHGIWQVERDIHLGKNIPGYSR